ncbi:MAG: ribosomal protein S18-alanine N-acetyltransferase [Nitrososphaerota archaeon]|nr:ribosomal protein S18-alanine N-acetyltransferase [Aigarchaeota archaeon]MDW8077071.1 ribosomal protein S18-alanine N-acetyltransferase [Nitrososphaerota archaeon]
MEIVIRAFRPSDLEEVCKIERESFRDPWPCYTFIYFYTKNPENIKVAAIDGRIVGYVVVDIEKQDDKKVGHILNLAVEQSYRRRGIGRMLMNAAISYAKGYGAREVLLEVRESNVTVRKFYSSMGFVEKGRIRHYYHDEDAIVMCREIE